MTAMHSKRRFVIKCVVYCAKGKVELCTLQLSVEQTLDVASGWPGLAGVGMQLQLKYSCDVGLVSHYTASGASDTLVASPRIASQPA